MKKLSKKAEEKAAEASRLATLLKQKSDAYIDRIEASETKVNYDQLPADQLLVVEAFNDWSAGALGEDVDVRFTYSGTDPTCSTIDELKNLLDRLHGNRAILYPVTGFVLSDDEQNLEYRPMDATYRLRPHLDGSRASAVRVAESKHVSSLDAAHQLWIFSATEDCFAYLSHQMGLYGLQLEDEDASAVRRLVASYLQDRFSPGQVWNAMWRSVKHAAALSKRQYFNSTKAAKTLPKQIDKVLHEALEDASFHPYDRMLSTPVGAVLMLFQQRFGIGDTTPGSRAREILASDAALAPPAPPANPADDEASGAASDSDERNLTRGTLYYSEDFTELDKLVLSCFDGIQVESELPEWDEAGLIGRLDFTLPGLYAFDGLPYYKAVMRSLGAAEPSDDEVARRAQEMPDNRWATEAAFSRLSTEALLTAGVSPNAAHRMSVARRFPIEPEDVVAMVRGVPLPSGLVGMRIDYTTLYDDYAVSKEALAVGDLTLEIPQRWLEPDACDDEDLVRKFVAGDSAALTLAIATALSRGLRSADGASQPDLLEQIGTHLVAIADRDRASRVVEQDGQLEEQRR